MIKVKDVDGKEVRGVFRGPNGSLVVQDDKLLNKYLIEKRARENDQLKIKTLEEQVASLSSMVQQLLENSKAK